MLERLPFKSHLSVDELEERGLSGAVGPDEGEPGVEVDAELEVLVDVGRVLVVAEADVLHHHHGRRDRPARVEVELHASLAHHLQRHFDNSEHELLTSQGNGNLPLRLSDHH